MGGADLDLNDAELAAERTELTVFSLMGGVGRSACPTGLNVEVSDFAFMGGNGVDVGGRAARIRAARCCSCG